MSSYGLVIYFQKKYVNTYDNYYNNYHGTINIINTIQIFSTEYQKSNINLNNSNSNNNNNNNIDNNNNNLITINYDNNVVIINKNNQNSITINELYFKYYDILEYSNIIKSYYLSKKIIIFIYYSFIIYINNIF